MTQSFVRTTEQVQSGPLHGTRQFWREGTGLGLSISHDIIVKQHAGLIEVDTQLGECTEIRVTLPRVAALLPERS
jgi:signal transduction histidine kinase